ncbi:MAG: hypothetical protein HY822_11415, partial [Acidobacteria bacterium]|nr:hypothetical protein [Acidobacteriota bacterium]
MARSMPGNNGSDASARLDRIEAIIEVPATRQADIEDEFSRLLRAQVVIVGSVRKLADSQRHADERMNALIAVAGGL